MNSPLIRCTICKRHIYASESSCPFCARQSSVSPTVLVAALTAGLAMAGCGAATTQSVPPEEVWPHPDTRPDEPKQIAEDPKQDPPPNVTPAPVYGAPPPVSPVPGPPAAAYGAPPPMAPTPR